MRRRYSQRLPGVMRPLRQQPTIPAFIDSALTAPRAGLIARMAEDMRETAATAGGVTDTDLIARGYTPAQIKLHGDDARARAQLLAGPSL